jgi:hypothetical protein
MPFLSCSTNAAQQTALAAAQAAQDAAIAALQGGGGVTAASVATAVNTMTPAQLAAMCTKLNCQPTAAALTAALMSLSGSSTAGNVLTIVGGVPVWQAPVAGAASTVPATGVGAGALPAGVTTTPTQVVGFNAAALATVPAATDTVQGKVALAVAANYPDATNDADAVTPAYLTAAQAAQDAAIAAIAANAGAAYLPKTNGVATNLTLAGDATAALGAVTLQQMQVGDTANANALAGHLGASDPHSQYVKKAGDTMTGALTYPNVVNPTDRLNAEPRYGYDGRRILISQFQTPVPSLFGDWSSGAEWRYSDAANPIVDRPPNTPVNCSMYIQRAQYAANAAGLIALVVDGNTAFHSVWAASFYTGVVSWKRLDMPPARVYLDKTATRLPSVVYTNVTAGSIGLYVRTNGASSAQLTIKVDGVIVSQLLATTAGQFGTTSAEIPSGSTYEVVSSAGVAAWLELT